MVKYNYVRRRINSLIGMGILFFSQKRMQKEKEIPELEKYFLSEKVVKYVMATGTKNFIVNQRLT